jgi:uncharacterized tellurite resistance protein B-like protein
MNDRLSTLYEGVAIHATADREHRAALELLALVTMADRHIDPDEIDAIREIAEDWRGGSFSFEQHLGPAMARARKAVADDAVDALLADIDERITSRVLRLALLAAAREVAGVDDALSPEEGSLLADLAVRFG